MWYEEQRYAQLIAVDTREDIRKWVAPYWMGRLRELEAYNRKLPNDFLDRDIGGLTTADPSLMLQEAAFLMESYTPEEINGFLGIDIHGPFKRNLLTSIHHLYQLTLWREQGEPTPSSVVEWGGGYGDFAFIFKRLFPEVQYTIIDLPRVSLIQWSYLGSLLGWQGVNYVARGEGLIEKPECINIIPVTRVGFAPEVEMFISMFALSESSALSQDYVVGRNFFSAERILLAYEPEKTDLFPDTEHFVSTILPAVADRGDRVCFQRDGYVPTTEYMFG